MTILAEHSPLPALARSASAVSAEAQTLLSAASAARESLERSIALFGPKAAAISRIWALAFECAEIDWDGAGAEPISAAAAKRAADLIRALLDNVPLPEFAPEPDGSISMDWIQSRNRLLSLSVGTSSRLAYAWLDGTDRGHAVAYFDGERVPPLILETIKGIVNHGSAPVRSTRGC